MSKNKKVKVDAPVPATKVNVLLTNERLSKSLASWSPADTRAGVETVLFAIGELSKTHSSHMAIGVRFNAFADDHSAEQVSELCDAASGLRIAGLTVRTIGEWRARAVLFVAAFVSPNVQRHILLLTGGRGIITRSEGKKGVFSYSLSQFYTAAKEKVAASGETEPTAQNLNDESAERYARLVVMVASGLKGRAHNGQDIGKRGRAVVKMFGNFVAAMTAEDKKGRAPLAAREACLYDVLSDILDCVMQGVTNLDEFGAVLKDAQDGISESGKRPQVAA